jgi:hypothetical protein
MHQEGGRQVTRTLSQEEAERLRPLVAADRRLRALVAELESLTVSELAARGSVIPAPVGKSRRKSGK